MIELGDSSYANYYFRAVVHIALGREEEAKSDLIIAAKLAYEQHQINCKDGHDALNLALCYLVMGDFGQAKRFYREGLSKGVSKSRIQVSIDDLKDYLCIRPKSKEAIAVKKALEGRLKDKGT